MAVISPHKNGAAMRRAAMPRNCAVGVAAAQFSTSKISSPVCLPNSITDTEHMDEKAALTLRKQTAATPVRNVCFTKLAFSVIFTHESLSGRCSTGRWVAVGPLVRVMLGRCAPGSGSPGSSPGRCAAGLPGRCAAGGSG